MNELHDGRSDELAAEAMARRNFLKSAGKFAAVTPPAIVLLLGTTLGSKAIAASSGARPGHGWGDKKHTHIHKKHIRRRKFKAFKVKR